MEILRKIIILAIVSALAYYTSEVGGEFYRRIFGPSGALIDLRSLSGLPLTYIFFLFFFFTAFGRDKKYWWLWILLIPAAAFEVYFDLEHIYFPVLLGIGGWLLGYIVSTYLLKAIQ